MPDGKPDFTGIWNGQRTVSQDGPYLQPWAQKLLEQRAANNYADDLEARCLPGGPPRAAPYHTSLVSTPKLVLMLFEGNTHMFRQFFVDGSGPSQGSETHLVWRLARPLGRRDAGGGHHRFQRQILDRYARPSAHVADASDRALQPPELGTLNIGITIDDPGAYTKPWIQNRSTTLETGIEMTEYVCNENNQDPVHLDGAHK